MDVKCPICNSKDIRAFSSLYSHQYTEYEYVCEDCGHKFKHYKLHEGNE